MSEFILVQPSDPQSASLAASQFGLQVVSEQPIQVQRTAPVTGPVTALGSSASDVLAAASEDDPTIFTLLGVGGNDTLLGGAGTDTISGGAGNDRIAGRGGDDNLVGEGGKDSLSGGDGNDTLQGGDGIDSLFGGSGRDVIVGGAGNDTLNGGAGNDLIEGGAGKDKLTGGAGRDRFRFGPDSKGSVDSVTDFDPKRDRIEISLDLLPRSELRIGRLKVNDFAVVDKIGSGDIAKIIYEQSTGLVYYNSPTRGANVALFQLQKDLPVTSSDFEIF